MEEIGSMIMSTKSSRNKDIPLGMAIIGSTTLAFWGAVAYGAMQIPTVNTAVHDAIETVRNIDRSPQQNCLPS